MFERKNQNILSDHYSKLISHDPDSDDDFITLKRADHDLNDLPSTITATHPTTHTTTFEQDLTANLSKRKQKMGKAKRAIATSGVNTKLIFDDEGEAHQLYELEDGEKWFEERGGLVGAQEEGKKFAEGERGKMKVADIVDRQEAKEKKREKKRKRKEREKNVSAFPCLLPIGGIWDFDVCFVISRCMGREMRVLPQLPYWHLWMKMMVMSPRSSIYPRRARMMSPLRERRRRHYIRDHSTKSGRLKKTTI